MRTSGKVPALVACLVSGAVLGACGGSNDTSTADSVPTAGSATTKTATAQGKPQQSSIDYMLKYTGGKAGAADPAAKPFVVGWVNQQGSTPAYPEMEPGSDAAVKFINEQLGGMAG